MGGQRSEQEREYPLALVGRRGVWTLKDEYEFEKLGFSWRDAGERRDIFADQLIEIGGIVNNLLSEQLATKGENWLKEMAALGEKVAVKALHPDGVPGDIDAFLIGELSDVLRLEPESLDSPRAIQPQLKEMRDKGNSLWKDLNAELKKMLKEDYGLLKSDPTVKGKQVPFLVQLPQLEDAPAAPICWNMFYDTDPARPTDPLRFWGFRIPIAQWFQWPRTNLIDVRPALTAADGGLPLASPEARLAKTFAGDANCFAFECELQSVLGATGSEEWLDLYLRGLDKRYTDRASLPEAFEAKLGVVLARHYGLMHFSCHCEPAGGARDPDRERNPPERQLQIALAGANIRISRDFLTTKLRPEDAPPIKKGDPGGLVFLNACGSSKQVKAQFPDLPKTWIQVVGAKAVIATLCDIPDIFAYAFALKLYQVLYQASAEFREIRGKSAPLGFSPTPPDNLYLDSALLATRRFFMENFGNPLGLAYELYAYPNARLDPPLEGTNP